MATGFLTIRIIMETLGSANYAVFAVLSGVQGWFALADIGLGSSVQNHISERRSKNLPYTDYERATFLLVIPILVVLAIMLLLFVQPLSLWLLKPFNIISDNEKIAIFLFFGSLSLIGGISNIIYRIWYSEFRGYLSNALPAAAAAVSLCWIYVASHSNIEHRLLWVIAGLAVPTSFFPAAAFAARGISKGWGLPDRSVLRPLCLRAVKFAGFALLSAVVLQVDYLMLSQFAQPHEIVVYNFCSKIFSIVFFIYMAVMNAAWPVFAEAAAGARWNELRVRIRRYIATGCLLVFVSTALLFVAMPSVVSLLSPREEIVVPTQLLVLFGVYYGIRIITDTYGTVAQSMSYVRPFLLYIPFQAGLNLLLQWCLVPKIGAAGVVVSLIASFLATAFWIIPFALSRRVKELSKLAV